MSKTDLHAPFNTFSGTIGKLVYRVVDGKTIVSQRPKRRNVPPSEAALAHQQNFKRASRWAKVTLLDEEKGPFYKALGKKRKITAYAAAVSDFLKPPALEELDLSGYAGHAGDRISFIATDQGSVANATVTILDWDKTVLESGSAVENGPGSGIWTYTALNTLPAGLTVGINVKVSDHPGNTAELAEEKAL